MPAVFVNTTLRARLLAELLREGAGVAALELVGTMTLRQREAAIGAFRHRDCLVLVASDVAARGLGAPGACFYFDPPQRVGRGLLGVPGVVGGWGG